VTDSRKIHSFGFGIRTVTKLFTTKRFHLTLYLLPIFDYMGGCVVYYTVGAWFIQTHDNEMGHICRIGCQIHNVT